MTYVPSQEEEAFVESKDWATYITDILSERLKEAGVSARVMLFNEKVLDSRYACVRISHAEKAKNDFDYLAITYFLPMLQSFTAVAGKNGWNQVQIKVEITTERDNDFVMVWMTSGCRQETPNA